MKKGRDYWSRHIAAWRQSGQSRKAYCEEHGLSYWSMRNWISKLPEAAAPESQRLVELEPIAFALGQWRKLIHYLDHPQLTPDNNSCEQAIRPFVIGRKNWLFSGSPRGAAASALLYSLIETAKANGLELYGYLRELFEKLPIARTRADYLALLPTARPSPPPP